MALLQNNQVRPYDRNGLPSYEYKAYPKHLVPPGNTFGPKGDAPADPMKDYVVVRDEHEEAAQKAMWNVGNGETAAGYPKWMFHPAKPPVMVRSKAEEDAHGRGWYPTPAEAVAAAGGAPVPVPVPMPQMAMPAPVIDTSTQANNPPPFDHQAEGAVLNATGPQTIDPPGEGFTSWDEGDESPASEPVPVKRGPGRPPKAK